MAHPVMTTDNSFITSRGLGATLAAAPVVAELEYAKKQMQIYRLGEPIVSTQLAAVVISRLTWIPPRRILRPRRLRAKEPTILRLPLQENPRAPRNIHISHGPIRKGHPL